MKGDRIAVRVLAGLRDCLVPDPEKGAGQRVIILLVLLLPVFCFTETDRVLWPVRMRPISKVSLIPEVLLSSEELGIS